MSTNSYQARETLKQEKKTGSLINAAGREKALAAVYLDNGTVIASPYTVRVLMNAVERSNRKALKPPKGAYETRRLRVWDAVDEAPPDDAEEDTEELSAEWTEEPNEDY